MKAPSAPLRFVTLAVGGWIGVRIVMLSLDGAAASDAAPPVPAVPVASARPIEAPPAPAPTRVAGVFSPKRAPFSAARPRPLIILRMLGPRVEPTVPRSQVPALPMPFVSSAPHRGTEGPAILAALTGQAPQPPAPRRSRWSGSAWLFVREGDAPSLAPGGELGGSQAGARVTYGLIGERAPLALSARAYVPLDRPGGAEAAVGFDWRPVPGLPVNLLVERREAIGRDGRSDFAVTLYGGGERRLAGGRLRIEAYGQAGVVGHDDPDLFADGLVRATTPVGPVDVGGGIWGGAQPGAHRIDAGPHVSARVPIRGANIRIMAEWRFRIAGDAAPGSGPALTVASDF